MEARKKPTTINKYRIPPSITLLGCRFFPRLSIGQSPAITKRVNATIICNGYGLPRKYTIYIEFIDDLYGIYRGNLARLSGDYMMNTCETLPSAHQGGYMELIYLLIIIGFFLASIGVVELLDRLRSIK